MDEATIGYATYRWHQIANPYTLEQLERTLAVTDLKAGDKAVDIGCGNGFVAAWLAERYGLQMTGVERYPGMAALARETAAQPRARGALEVVEGLARDHLAQAGEHRLLCLLGAIDVTPGVRRPAEVLAALLPSVAPGGWLLWGDPFWKAPPSDQLKTVFIEERFESLEGWMQAGEGVGLVPAYAAVSAEAEWERYIWTMNASLLDFATSASEPEASICRMSAAMARNLYLSEGRERMGFGLYLFQRPES